MAVVGDKAERQLKEITECPICMNTFTDPRLLPCIHTFCLACLRHMGEVQQRRPGDKMSCPLCRTKFTIPSDGLIGLQRNFFMDNFLEFKETLQDKSPTLKNGTETVEAKKPKPKMRPCTKHSHKKLDYYCAECKEIVCVSCFVESHKLHDCKDVVTIEDEFRRTIRRAAFKTSNYAEEIISLRNKAGMIKADFLKKIEQEETAIIIRNHELKELIDKHTKSVLDELSVIKSDKLTEMENQVEEIDRCSMILRKFMAYCSELASKVSAVDICSSVDELIARADELERDHETFIGRPYQSVEISFQAKDLRDVLQYVNNNLVGKIVVDKTEDIVKSEKFAVVVGFCDGLTATKDVTKINLHRPNEISTEEEIPTTVLVEAFAAVYCNTIYVTGTGDNCDEIWKYNVASGWTKCASLVHGRRRHSSAFIDDVLYICGGFVDSDKRVLDSVEGYNAITDTCVKVGELAHCVDSSGNCVPFRSSLYIFGGFDQLNKELNYVQVYNTNENKCSVLSRPMPRPYHLMRAVLWETSVILLRWNTCFIFNLETKSWQERKQFRTDSVHFGLILDDDRLFVIGGGDSEYDKDGKIIWTLRDDVRYVPIRNILDDKAPEWKIHGKLPKPSLAHACVTLRL